MPDVDHCAGGLYALVGADPQDPPGPHALARLLGFGLRRSPLPVALATAEWRTPTPEIVLRWGQAPSAEARQIAHLLACWWLDGEQDAQRVARLADALSTAA